VPVGVQHGADNLDSVRELLFPDVLPGVFQTYRESSCVLVLAEGALGYVVHNVSYMV
jgi:hypothetical protein